MTSLHRRYSGDADLDPNTAPDVPLLDLEPFPDLEDVNDRASFYSHPEPQPHPHYRFSRWGIRSPRRIIILVSVIKFTIVLCGMLIMLPYARLIEDMLCHAHYQDTSSEIIEEMKCKVDEVQSRMGFLLGWNSLFSSMIGDFLQSANNPS